MPQSINFEPLNLRRFRQLETGGHRPTKHSCPFVLNVKGKHIHTYRGLDLGEEMSHVEGAIVVRRPDLTQSRDGGGMLAPAHGVDFVATLQAYFATSETSLLRHAR